MQGKRISYFSLHIIVALIVTMPYYSCSTVKVLSDGESMLKANKIKLLNNSRVRSGELLSLVRQQPNNSVILGWKPAVVMYNWTNGKFGQAPVVFDSSSIARSKDNIDNFLVSRGYYNSIIKDTVITSNKRTKVEYSILTGSLFRIDTVYYDIADISIADILRKEINNSTLRKGSVLSERRLDAEGERLSSILRNEGYYNFNKNYFFFEADTSAMDGTAKLYVTLNNHTRSGAAGVNVEPHRKYQIRDISVYSDYDPMRDVERDTSDSYNIIKMDYLTIYEVNKKNSVRAGVIDRLNLIKPGERYSERTANNTYNRFVSLRYYTGVNLQFDEVSGSSKDSLGEVDLTIRLTPSKSQGFKINLEASTNSNGLFGISPNISYYHKNIFRGGEWFNLGFMGNFQFKFREPIRSTELGVSAGISFPEFLFLPKRLFETYVPRTDINLGYNYQHRPEFTRNLISATFGYNWRGGERFQYTLNPIQLSIIKLSNVDPDFHDQLQNPFLRNAYRDYFDIGAGGTIYFNTLGSNIDPGASRERSSFYLRWIYDVSGNILSLFNSTMSIDTATGDRLLWNTPYAQYIRSDLYLVRTWSINRNTSLATRLNIGIGYAYGNSNAMPFEKLFYAGGSNSMRGWVARTLGPGSMPMNTTFSIPNQTGDIKLELNTEYRFRMFWKFEGALFGDVGNVWTLRSEAGTEAGQFRIKDFYKSLAANWGVGLRFDISFVIFRLDMGMIVRDPYRDEWFGPSKWLRRDNFAIQFGINYPF